MGLELDRENCLSGCVRKCVDFFRSTIQEEVFRDG